MRKLRAGVMPPAGRPRPDASTQGAFVSWLESELDGAAASRPNPGRTEAFHRLARTEYQNAIRDLLAVEIDVTTLLPPDDKSYGFDNIAGVLTINESLMERYLFCGPESQPPGCWRSSSGAHSCDLPDSRRISAGTERVEGLPFGTRGGGLFRYHFPRDGEYLMKIEFAGSTVEAAAYDPSTGFVDPHEVELSVDGRRAHLFTLEPKPIQRRLNDEDDGAVSVRIPVRAGPREIGVTFLRLPSIEEADGPRQRFVKPLFQSLIAAPNMAVYQPFVKSVTISGPFDMGGTGETPSRHRIFECRPVTPSNETACAQRIIASLARRAFRRPATAEEVSGVLGFYKLGRVAADGSFDAGIETALRRILTSPNFLFRIDTDPPGLAVGSVYRLSDLALASRLSFLLWSSIPDDELLDLAVAGKLKNPAVLRRQVDRMLADERSDALVTNFGSQWLELRKLSEVRPDGYLFPDFEDSLREAFQRETELFLASVFRENRSVLDLLTANYTFLNGRLARHYGVPHIQGGFQRYTFPETSLRRGLLGHGSILTLTSMPNRTSPVVRGKWVLDHSLGAPPPPPPPDVPPFPEQKHTQQVLSVRERTTQHRANPACATCHSMIDPPGFALESFDAIGRERTVDEGFKPIDTTGGLPDGSKFADVAGLRSALVGKPERFVTTFTEKLLIYALGRGVEYYDMPAIRKIVREAAQQDYRFGSLVLGIAMSEPFQMRRMGS